MTQTSAPGLSPIDRAIATSPAVEQALEVKKGFIKLNTDDFIRKEVLKDVSLRDDPDTPITTVA